jgi:hypothetical protein
MVMKSCWQKLAGLFPAIGILSVCSRIPLKLVGVKSNRAAIGARVKVTVENQGHATRSIYRRCSLFGVDAWPDEALLTPSLHTAIIDRKGRLAANLEGLVHGTTTRRSGGQRNESGEVRFIFRNVLRCHPEQPGIYA